MNVKVKDAARILGKSILFVRCGLISGKLPIGTAIQMTGKQYSYHISPGKLAQYMGMTIEQMLKILDEQNL